MWLASVGAVYKSEPGRIAIVPAPKWDEKAGKLEKMDSVAIILITLDNEVQLKEGANINEIPLFELLQNLSKRYQLTFVINEVAFKQYGIQDIKEQKPNGHRHATSRSGNASSPRSHP